MTRAWPLFAPVVAPKPPGPVVADVVREARHASVWLADASPLLLARRRRPHRVAVASGSRGLSGLPGILGQLCGLLRTRGIEPFLVPAMGSHGGGTGAGQRKVLAGLGITEEAIGVPIAAADGPAGALPVGRTPAGRRIYCHQATLAADAVILVNRVKPHTAFEGEVQSGLLKMLVVGLGGPEGATETHRGGAARLEEAILDGARALAGLLPLAGGLATVENSLGEVALLRPCRGGWADLRSADRRCLELARRLDPALPVDELDLLLVDYMGKDISGTGLRPGVVGRRRAWDYPEPSRPRVRRLVVFRLTAGSAGNANGIGLADFTTRRLAERIDWNSTLRNVQATTLTQRAALPPVLPSDREAVRLALETLHLDDWRRVRAMRLRDTAHLGSYFISQALCGEAGEPVGPWRPLPWNEDGDLADLEES